LNFDAILNQVVAGIVCAIIISGMFALYRWVKKFCRDLDRAFGKIRALEKMVSDLCQKDEKLEIKDYPSRES